MDLKDSFRKIAEQKEKQIEDERRIKVRQEKEQIAEIEAANDKFTPIIEKVCKTFAEALKYEYERYKKYKTRDSFEVKIPTNKDSYSEKWYKSIIEKVCKAFTKAIGYEYEKSKVEYKAYLNSFKVKSPTIKDSFGNERYKLIKVFINSIDSKTYHKRDQLSSYEIGFPTSYDKEIIEISPRTIVVEGGSYSSLWNTGYPIYFVRGIPFNKLTEEELTKAFEDCYNKVF